MKHAQSFATGGGLCVRADTTDERAPLPRAEAVAGSRFARSIQKWVELKRVGALSAAGCHGATSASGTLSGGKSSGVSAGHSCAVGCTMSLSCACATRSRTLLPRTHKQERFHCCKFRSLLFFLFFLKEYSTIRVTNRTSPPAQRTRDDDQESALGRRRRKGYDVSSRRKNCGPGEKNKRGDPPRRGSTRGSPAVSSRRTNPPDRPCLRVEQIALPREPIRSTHADPGLLLWCCMFNFSAQRLCTKSD
jgi:hypothetical protein